MPEMNNTKSRKKKKSKTGSDMMQTVPLKNFLVKNIADEKIPKYMMTLRSFFVIIVRSA